PENTTQLYRSPNGDTWFLARDPARGRGFCPARSEHPVGRSGHRTAPVSPQSRRESLWVILPGGLLVADYFTRRQAKPRAGRDGYAGLDAERGPARGKSISDSSNGVQGYFTARL